MTIRNKNDLRIAYVILRMCMKGKPNSDRLPELKREIRRYLREHNDSDRRLVKGDWDSYVLLITLPDFIATAEDADEWFMDREYIERYYTYYDCTGKPFTSWYKLFKRNGRWMAYHSVGVDV